MTLLSFVLMFSFPSFSLQTYLGFALCWVLDMRRLIGKIYFLPVKSSHISKGEIYAYSILIGTMTRHRYCMSTEEGILTPSRVPGKNTQKR